MDLQCLQCLPVLIRRRWQFAIAELEIWTLTWDPSMSHNCFVKHSRAWILVWPSRLTLPLLRLFRSLLSRCLGVECRRIQSQRCFLWSLNIGARHVPRSEPTDISAINDFWRLFPYLFHDDTTERMSDEDDWSLHFLWHSQAQHWHVMHFNGE